MKVKHTLHQLVMLGFRIPTGDPLRTWFAIQKYRFAEPRKAEMSFLSTPIRIKY